MYAVLSISSPASMCVRSDADGSVGAVSSELEVHACSSGSDDHMSSVSRSADSLCVPSSDIFSSEVSDVRYMIVWCQIGWFGVKCFQSSHRCRIRS